MSKNNTHGLGLAINLLQGSIDGLRSEVTSGFRGINERLESKADKADVVTLSTRFEKLEHDTDVAIIDIDGRFRKIEDVNLVSVTHDLQEQADRRRKWTFREKVFASIGTLYIGGTPIILHFLVH